MNWLHRKLFKFALVHDLQGLAQALAEDWDPWLLSCRLGWGSDTTFFRGKTCPGAFVNWASKTLTMCCVEVNNIFVDLETTVVFNFPTSIRIETLRGTTDGWRVHLGTRPAQRLLGERDGIFTAFSEEGPWFAMRELGKEILRECKRLEIQDPVISENLSEEDQLKKECLLIYVNAIESGLPVVVQLSSLEVRSIAATHLFLGGNIFIVLLTVITLFMMRNEDIWIFSVPCFTLLCAAWWARKFTNGSRNIYPKIRDRFISALQNQRMKNLDRLTTLSQEYGGYQEIPSDKNNGTRDHNSD